MSKKHPVPKMPNHPPMPKPISCALCGYFCNNYHHHNNWIWETINDNAKYVFIKDYTFMSGSQVMLYIIPKGSILKKHENGLWYSFDNGQEHSGCFNDISSLKDYIEEYNGNRGKIRFKFIEGDDQ